MRRATVFYTPDPPDSVLELLAETVRFLASRNYHLTVKPHERAGGVTVIVDGLLDREEREFFESMVHVSLRSRGKP